ncbi:hypothetical protein JOQ06_015348, partial [Pogonophryne albipinna]
RVWSSLQVTVTLIRESHCALVFLRHLLSSHQGVYEALRRSPTSAAAIISWELHVTSKRRAKCVVYLPERVQVKANLSGRRKMLLAETIHPKRENRQPNKTWSQRFLHWSQESFRVPKETGLQTSRTQVKEEPQIGNRTVECKTAPRRKPTVISPIKTGESAAFLNQAREAKINVSEETQ